MKTVLCEKDILLLKEKGETRCVLTGDTIVTPSARDAAQRAGIAFVEGEAAPAAPAPAAQSDDQELSVDLIYKVLKGLSDCGALDPKLFDTTPPKKP